MKSVILITLFSDHIISFRIKYNYRKKRCTWNINNHVTVCKSIDSSLDWDLKRSIYDDLKFEKSVRRDNDGVCDVKLAVAR
jgi:hypothetical protein